MRVVVSQFAGAGTLHALPLAAGLVVASARRDPALAAAVDFDIRIGRPEPDAVAASLAGSDLLAFSCYAWNARYSLEVARRAKALSPRAMVVLGGPSVPRRSARIAAFLAEHETVDALVLGEGEVTFAELLRARLAGQPLEQVAGLALRGTDGPAEPVLTPARPRLRDFSETASPFLDGTFEALLERHGRQLSAAVLETNRGCPFGCTFCDWGQATQSRVHELPLARVQAELGWIAEHAIPYLYIVDANFGIRPRDLGIVEVLADLKGRTGYPTFCYFHLTKNAKARNLATVEALRRAGIGSQVALSMQDFDAGVLQAVKRANISLERSLELRGLCNARGIPTFNELILGLPEQTYASFRDSLVAAVTPYPGDSFFLYLCRLLENAEMATEAQRARYGLRTRLCQVGAASQVAEADWVDEREELVVGMRSMPPDDWRRAFRFGQLLSAFHNLRLLDVVVHALRWGLGLDLGSWVEAIEREMTTVPRESALGRLDRLVETYLDALLADGRLLLPQPGTGSHLWSVGDALAIAALRDRARFYTEVAAATRGWLVRGAGCDGEGAELPAGLVDDLIAYQEAVTPALGRHQPIERGFGLDWPALRRDLHGPWRPLARQAAVLRFVPPDWARQDVNELYFWTCYLAAAYGKGAQTRVERVDRWGAERLGESPSDAQGRAGAAPADMTP